jgi:hypothetical protein
MGTYVDPLLRNFMFIMELILVNPCNDHSDVLRVFTCLPVWVGGIVKISLLTIVGNTKPGDI